MKRSMIESMVKGVVYLGSVEPEAEWGREGGGGGG